MDKRGSILIILLLALGLFVWRLFWPTFGQVYSLFQERNLWQTKLEQANDLSRKLGILQQEYSANEEEMNKIKTAVPMNEDTPALLVQLEALASQNGLILNSVNFLTPENQKKNNAQAIPSAAVKTTRVDLSLSGSYGSFKNFIKAVENNLRIMDINFIGLGSQETSVSAGLGLTDFKVSMNVYYHQ